MSLTYLDFEKPIQELEEKIAELREMSSRNGQDYASEIDSLEQKSVQVIKQVVDDLSPWQRCQLARHPNRPIFPDVIEGLFTEFVELHGDRVYGDDRALIGGLARFNDEPVMIMGHQRGRSTRENIVRNFAMSRPEGYRKSQRLMKLAEKFGLPVITFIDTPGAYPGMDAEERGQSEAIAKSIQVMATLRVPTVVVVIGEGGSGGALAIGVGNDVMMLENSFYSVISPEGCASILWRDASYAEEAARALKINAADLKELGLIDGIIPEPLGGAHRDYESTFRAMRDALAQSLQQWRGLGGDQLVAQRYEKFRKMGDVEIQTEPSAS